MINMPRNFSHTPCDHIPPILVVALRMSCFPILIICIVCDRVFMPLSDFINPFQSLGNYSSNSILDGLVLELDGVDRDVPSIFQRGFSIRRSDRTIVLNMRIRNGVLSHMAQAFLSWLLENYSNESSRRNGIYLNPPLMATPTSPANPIFDVPRPIRSTTTPQMLQFSYGNVHGPHLNRWSNSEPYRGGIGCQSDQLLRSALVQEVREVDESTRPYLAQLDQPILEGIIDLNYNDHEEVNEIDLNLRL